MSADEDKMQHVFITGLVSQQTKGPRVQIEIGDCKTQCTAEKAREIALMILEASEAAMSDAFLVNFLMEKTKVPYDAAITVMAEFREYRDEERRKG